MRWQAGGQAGWLFPVHCFRLSSAHAAAARASGQGWSQSPSSDQVGYSLLCCFRLFNAHAAVARVSGQEFVSAPTVVIGCRPFAWQLEAWQLEVICRLVGWLVPASPFSCYHSLWSCSKASGSGFVSAPTEVINCWTLVWPSEASCR